MRLTLGRVRGIPILLHGSALALMALYLGWTLLREGWVAWADAALVLLLASASVLLHELGHALSARWFGVGTREITLYPFGGLALLTREPPTARAELVISLAGPAVNLVLALLGALLVPEPLGGLVVALNLGLGLFNLLPAFPMDGGRVLRALLSGVWGRLRATQTALSVSRVFAWGFVVLGLFGNPMLLLVGLMVHLAIRAERARLWAAQRGRSWIPAGVEPVAEAVLRHPVWQHPAV